MRITVSHVDAKVSTFNSLMGIRDVSWNTVGAIRLQGEYGGYAVEQCSGEHGSVHRLTATGTLREAAIFLDGMIAAIRMQSK
jgi:hypothetical protein